MDDRRVYEVIGGAGSADTTITDFEKRVVVRSANSLKITGDSAAHVIVRWRFDRVKDATVNGDAGEGADGHSGQLRGVRPPEGERGGVAVNQAVGCGLKLLAGVVVAPQWVQKIAVGSTGLLHAGQHGPGWLPRIWLAI